MAACDTAGGASEGKGYRLMNIASMERRFTNKIVLTDSCTQWRGAKDRYGYGIFTICTKQYLAHRIAWFLKYGEFPSNTIDHLCRNHACVNVDHMEVVTIGENVLRGYGPTAINARKTICIRGHAFTEKNTRIRPDGTRKCRICSGILKREAKKRHKAKEATA